ncbi:hypothetical protein ET495_12460 [Xylanimonas allomyrinae]|uniref:Putative zinc-finger domain-containing protein n=1 Tax=Xylanimonas allomyrinae TaxID=2509459 RepID=A0A4P6EM48_9MICO|nr:zf-HC2 domain-containing protein [Xylanimonas allomyrinae]QAY63910.1 hypothetical protein ET495_12460 [Xylanimonas allomyrinae]
MTTDAYATWDGAYVLGALSPAERDEYEDHLRRCAACARAVAELGELPPLLGMLSAVDAGVRMPDDDAAGGGRGDGGSLRGGSAGGFSADGGSAEDAAEPGVAAAGTAAAGTAAAGTAASGTGASGTAASGTVASGTGTVGPVGASPADAAAARTGDADGAVEPERTGADVVPLARVAAAARRARRRHGALTAAAACALVLAGVAAGSLAGAPRVSGPGDGEPAPTSSVLSRRTVQLVPVGDGSMHADLSVTATPWGTRFDWRCWYALTDGLPTPDGYGSGAVTYQLVLVDRAGSRSVAATWTTSESAAEGLGASSALSIEALDRIEITAAGQDAALASARL